MPFRIAKWFSSEMKIVFLKYYHGIFYDSIVAMVDFGISMDTYVEESLTHSGNSSRSAELSTEFSSVNSCVNSFVNSSSPTTIVSGHCCF